MIACIEGWGNEDMGGVERGGGGVGGGWRFCVLLNYISGWVCWLKGQIGRQVEAIRSHSVRRWKVERDERRVGERKQKKKKNPAKKENIEINRFFFFHSGWTKNDPHLSRTLTLSLNHPAPTPPLLSLWVIAHFYFSFTYASQKKEGRKKRKKKKKNSSPT